MQVGIQPKTNKNWEKSLFFQFHYSGLCTKSKDPRSVFSRNAMSPTKMFESFAVGIPFICNKGIGDVDLILKRHKIGALIDLKKNISSKKNFIIYKQCKKIKSSDIIKKTKPFYDISFAKERYNHVYKVLENEQK